MHVTGPQYGFGLYVHWPYCSKICPYCDFNVYAAKDRDTDLLLGAIIADIAAQAAALPDHTPLDSLFLGGGTPSLLNPAQIEAIITAAETHLGLKHGAEITIEANPNDVLRSDLKGWAAAGVNRVSLGIQSLNNDALRFLGRDHSSANARAAIDAVQAVFDNHSIDLIYALPTQTEAVWYSELSAALALGASHLSLYELTIAERTAFGKRAERGELIPMDDDAQADLYELTQSLCNGAGIPAYEVSNHARAPQFQSVHNQIYWDSGDWLGVGPGAHGRLTIDGQRRTTLSPRRPAEYIADATPETTPLSAEDTALELLAMGLRPASGLDLSRYAALSETPLNAGRLQAYTDNGFLTQTDGRIALTPDGRLLADHIAAQLIT